MDRLACVSLPGLPPGEVAALAERLRRLSPGVEPRHDEPGLFWLDGGGLGRLFASASAWGRAIAAALTAERRAASVVVGFRRFAVYAVAKHGTAPLRIFRDLDEERRAAARVPLERLALPPPLRDFLVKLGVTTLGDYLGLPPGGLLLRFGEEAAQLGRLAAGAVWDPLRPEAPAEPVEERLLLDEPERDLTRLLFLLKGGVERLLGRLAARQQALVALFLDLQLAGELHQEELIRPAAATLDERLLLRLVHLRLEAAPPRAAVCEVLLGAAFGRARPEQLSLFTRGRRRDLRAAEEALAQLRAEHGNGAVCQAVLCDAHLPEAQFVWAPLERLALPRPRPDAARLLIRRIHARPAAVPVERQRTHEDGWLLSGLAEGAVVRLHGPYLLSGGWWQRAVERDYAFAETRRGDCLWLFYDRRRRTWLIQGAVE